MKKYFNIYKMTLLDSIQYLTNIIFNFITYALIIYIFLCLWKYLYQDESSLIEGYNLTQMIWYVLITEWMWFGGKNRLLINQIINDIKSGNIAYNLNKPYSYLIYMVTKHFGEITIKFIFYGIIGVILGFVYVGKLDTFNFSSIPLILLSMLLGLFIDILIRISISLLAFWIEDSGPFQWLYDKLILIIGTIFPVELFPKMLQPIINCSPIFVVNYGPAKLFVDFSFKTFKTIILAQIIYIVVVVLIATMIYRKGVRKLNVNGG